MLDREQIVDSVIMGVSIACFLITAGLMRKIVMYFNRRMKAHTKRIHCGRNRKTKIEHHVDDRNNGTLQERKN